MLFWSAFSRIWTEYGERISPYSVWIREITDKNNSEHGHFLRSSTHVNTIVVDEITKHHSFVQIKTSILQKYYPINAIVALI